MILLILIAYFFFLAKQIKLTTSKPKIRGHKLLSTKVALKANFTLILFIVSQFVRISIKVSYSNFIIHQTLVLLKKCKSKL